MSALLPLSQRPHPTLPFIMIHEQMDAEVSQAGWSYSIEELCDSGLYRSEADAREAAEKALFSWHGDYVEQRLRYALDGGDIDLALSIAHHRGFWQGVTKHKAKIAKNLKRAVDSLEPLLR